MKKAPARKAESEAQEQKAGPRPKKPFSPILQRRAEGGMIRIGQGTASLLENPDSVYEWDDEELREGRRRSKDGKFAGLKPKVIPRQVYDELMRRTIDHCLEEMRAAMPEMVRVLTAIAMDPGIPAKDKITAIDLCMKRVLGKEATNVNVAVTEVPAWQKAIDVSIVNEPEPDDEEFE